MIRYGQQSCQFPGSTAISRGRIRTGRRRVARRIWSLILAVLALPTLGFSQDLLWERLSDGLAVTVWKPGESCIGVPTMLAADIDPEHVRFSVHHYAEEGLALPPTIEQWQKRTGHQVLFNAGLFRENFAYLGLLYKDGRSVGSRRHQTWQGLFVAEPSTTGLQKARVLDLASDSFDEERPPYREAAQALMLLDRTGRIRVRQTGKLAYQTIVAEAGTGHILIFKSLEPVTLYDLGRCLRDTLPLVRQAMAMDGGSSSDVLVSESLLRTDGGAQERTPWKGLFTGKAGAHIPLPTVIGTSPR